MHKFRLIRYISVALIIIFLPVITYWVSIDLFQKNEFSSVPIANAANSGDFGVVTFVSSLPNNNNKQTIVSETTKLGVGWAREEYTYSDAIDFAPYDIAYSKLHAANISILGLLTYTEGKTHTQWKNYVTSVVSHFPGVTSWEIMNEADNYLSPADYVTFLKEAHTIIKGKNPNSKVILSGITARVESPNFWNGVSAAGGWNYFDAAGLHVFHNTDPYHDSYNNGTLAQEIQHAIDSLNRNGGGKKIWLTEFGWDSNKFGTDNQASWFSQGLPIVHGFSEVEKIFVYRMFENGNGFGLLTSGFSEKPAYNAVKDAISRIISGQVAVPVTTSTPNQSRPVQTPTPKVNKEKSSVRLDEVTNLEDGRKQYRIVVSIKDENDNIITSVKPKITFTADKFEITDFILVGNEWFAFVTSKIEGEDTVKITAGDQVLGTLQISFTAKDVGKNETTPSPLQSQIEIASSKSKLSIPAVIFYSVSSLLIVGLLTFLYFNRRSRVLKTPIN